MSNSFTESNRSSLEELRSYVERLNDQQLRQQIDDDWTVSGTLAHIAFWDRRAALVVERVLKDSAYQHVREDADIINATGIPQWRRLEPSEAIEDMIEAAEYLNRTVDLLDEETAQRLPASGTNVGRAKHRKEHLEQIRQHLA
jgi:hypothetical protein